MPTAEPDPGAAVEVATALSQAQAAEVLDLAGRAERADGVAPLSEDGLLHVRYGGGAGRQDLLLRSGGRLAGYARLDPPVPSHTVPGDTVPGQPAPAHGDQGHEDPGPAAHSAELVIDPGQRRRGLGRALAGALADQAAGPLQVWAHGDLPGARALAAAAGFERTRVLLRLGRPLSGPLAEPRLASGYAVRAFEVGRDEDAWTALNAAAFAGHPEQGGWTRADLERREREPWFDPAGFFLAIRDGRLAGFHWTKIHPATGHGVARHGPVGEVYVVGVDPAERGTGLGRALTLIGLHYLRDRGLAEVMLYADESNAPAVALYESLGFTRWSADVMFSRSLSDNAVLVTAVLVTADGRGRAGPHAQDIV
jgi:mycothiol synthase